MDNLVNPDGITFDVRNILRTRNNYPDPDTQYSISVLSSINMFINNVPEAHNLCTACIYFFHVFDNTDKLLCNYLPPPHPCHPETHPHPHRKRKNQPHVHTSKIKICRAFSSLWLILFSHLIKLTVSRTIYQLFSPSIIH